MGAGVGYKRVVFVVNRETDDSVSIAQVRSVNLALVMFAVKMATKQSPRKGNMEIKKAN